MPMSRRWDGIRDWSTPSTTIRPESTVSSPARTRRAVVLPHPDGPSRATSSPGASVRVNPSRAWVAPKRRRRPVSSTVAPAFSVAGIACRAVVVMSGTPSGLGHPSDAPDIERRDHHEDDPGDHQRQQRYGGRYMAVILRELLDPHRDGLVEVQTGHGELAEHEGDGQHRGRENGRAQIGDDDAP